jgi:hypothetical protein
VTNQPAEDAPQPTGPVISPGETLRRSVPEAAADDDGRPMSSAFLWSSHDKMMSTFRGTVSGEEAVARWTSPNSRLVGVWPVETAHLAELDRVAYDDGGQPCACGDSGCDAYPADHASVEMRDMSSRGRREKFARALKERAKELGPIHVV